MHKVKAKSILSSKNGMNLYRGCQHGCIYCDARSKCYQMDHEFEDIEVKENALELLEDALLKKREKCMIGTGAMSDPYIPLERDLELTRGALKLIDKHGFGLAIQTKSDLILRDLDLLKRINSKAKCVVQMTLTAFDDKTAQIIEPNVCVTSRRVEVLKIMKENNIPTVVWLCPFLPYINDTEENLLGLLNYCKDAGVKGIIYFGPGMTLRNGNREYFYKMLDKHYPLLKNRYVRNFADRYEVYRMENTKLFDYIIQEFCKKNDIMYDIDEVFYYMNNIEPKKQQLSLFDIE